MKMDMRQNKYINKVSILITLVLMAFSCSDDNRSFSVIPSIGFELTEGSVLESATGGIRVWLYSNVKLTETFDVTIAINNFQDLTYGVDYTTEPAAVNNTITLSYEPSGSPNYDPNDRPSFLVIPMVKVGSVFRQVGFGITSVSGSNLSLGQPASLSYTLNIKGLGCPVGIQALSISHNFDNCSDFATPSGFTEVFEPNSKTDRGWGCRAFGLNGTRAVRASAFGGTAGNDKTWLVMNPVRIAFGSSVKLHFWVFSNFSGPGVVNVKWSSDYSGGNNPLTATWQDLTAVDSEFPAPGSLIWKEIQKTFTNICGDNVYFAFQFTGATNTASASWDIEDITLTVQ